MQHSINTQRVDLTFYRLYMVPEYSVRLDLTRYLLHLISFFGAVQVPVCFEEVQWKEHMTCQWTWRGARVIEMNSPKNPFLPLFCLFYFWDRTVHTDRKWLGRERWGEIVKGPRPKLNLDRWCSSPVPRTFLWHCSEDVALVSCLFSMQHTGLG